MKTTIPEYLLRGAVQVVGLWASLSHKKGVPSKKTSHPFLLNMETNPRLFPSRSSGACLGTRRRVCLRRTSSTTPPAATSRGGLVGGLVGGLCQPGPALVEKHGDPQPKNCFYTSNWKRPRYERVAPFAVERCQFVQVAREGVKRFVGVDILCPSASGISEQNCNGIPLNECLEASFSTSPHSGMKRSIFEESLRFVSGKFSRRVTASILSVHLCGEDCCLPMCLWVFGGARRCQVLGVSGLGGVVGIPKRKSTIGPWIDWKWGGSFRPFGPSHGCQSQASGPQVLVPWFHLLGFHFGPLF